MKQFYTIIAILKIGEGVLVMLFPQRYARLWKVGPEPIQNAAEYLADNPCLTRCAGALEAACGLWLAHRILKG